MGVKIVRNMAVDIYDKNDRSDEESDGDKDKDENK